MQGLKEAWRESEAVFSSKSSAWPPESSLANPRGSSSRTSRTSARTGSTKSCELYPMQGMMRGGALFQLPPLGHTTRAGAGSVSRGSGRRLMWPTPRSTQEGRSFNSQFLNLTMAAQSPKYAEWGVGTLAKQTNGAMNPLFLEVKKINAV